MGATSRAPDDIESGREIGEHLQSAEKETGTEC